MGGKHNRRKWVCCSFLSLVLVCGCSHDDPAQLTPEPYAGIHGVVVDGSGDSLEGISVGLVYDLLGILMVQRHGKAPHDLEEKASTQISFTVPENTRVRVWIDDFAGDYVVTIVDDILQAGVYIQCLELPG